MSRGYVSQKLDIGITTEFTKKLILEMGCTQTNCNGQRPQFVGCVFETFCIIHGIKHNKASPYDPQTRGLAERFVQTSKNSVLKRGTDVNNINPWQFLESYRKTPHSTKGKSPSELMIGRRLPTFIDNMRYSLKSHNKEKS